MSLMTALQGIMGRRGGEGPPGHIQSSQSTEVVAPQENVREKLLTIINSAAVRYGVLLARRIIEGNNATQFTNFVLMRGSQRREFVVPTA